MDSKCFYRSFPCLAMLSVVDSQAHGLYPLGIYVDLAFSLVLNEKTDDALAFLVPSCAHRNTSD